MLHAKPPPEGRGQACYQRQRLSTASLGWAEQHRAAAQGRSADIIHSQNWQGTFLEEVGFSVAWMAGKDRVPGTTDTLFPAQRGINRGSGTSGRGTQSTTRTQDWKG